MPYCGVAHQLRNQWEKVSSNEKAKKMAETVFSFTPTLYFKNGKLIYGGQLTQKMENGFTSHNMEQLGTAANVAGFYELIKDDKAKYKYENVPGILLGEPVEVRW